MIAKKISQIALIVLIMFIAINKLNLDSSWLFVSGYFTGVLISAWDIIDNERGVK